jgi:flagellar basal-body rod protein FlgC
MMRRVFLLLVILQSSVFASEAPFGCSDMRQTQLSLSIHAANLANAISTRTPEGGAYKRKEIRRTESGNLEIISIEDSKLVYEPSHPDANKDGYVAYPNIIRATELAGIGGAAQKLKLMARARVCNMSILDSRLSSVIKYGADTEIDSDTFIWAREGKLHSWTRELKSGEEQIIHF